MKKPWLWTGITLGALVLIGLLISPLINRDKNENQENGFMQQTPAPGTQVRHDISVPEEQIEPERLRRRIANAAMSVEGVQEAWGLVLGNTAVVGVKLDSMIRGTAQQETINEVAEQVREIPDITKAVVTHEPQLVERIRKISEQLAEGQPTTKFTSDINDLIRKI